MIEQEQRVNNEAISAIITNLREAINSDSSSKDRSISGLQEGQERIRPVTTTPIPVVKTVSMMTVRHGDIRH